MPEPKGEESKTIEVPTEKMVLGPRTLELMGIDNYDAIDIVNGWQRLGAETYVTDFFLQRGPDRRHLIAKACIKFGPREVMNEWLGRRQILEEHGVSVPELIVVDGATIVEEFIEHAFYEAYASASSEDQETLKYSFVDMYNKVLSAGFSPIALNDIRSRGMDSVVIDFGEDLGPPNNPSSTSLGRVAEIESNFRRAAQNL
jgi:hypothetical protein